MSSYGHFLLDKKMDMRNKIILAEKRDALFFIVRRCDAAVEERRDFLILEELQETGKLRI